MGRAQSFGSGRHRVRVEDPRAGRVARVVLSAPDGNALTVDLLEALRAALEAVGAWPELSVVRLEGEGEDFCTGLSPRERRRPYIELLLPALHATARRLASMDALLLVGLRGRTFGAGLELALLGHWLVADVTAKLGFPDGLELGFPPLGALLLPERIGRTRADQWLLTNRVLLAKDAAELGLLTEFTGGWEPLETALDRIIDGPLLSVPRTHVGSWARALRPDLTRRLGPELDALERLYLERPEER